MAITKEKVTVCKCERCEYKWQPNIYLLTLKGLNAPQMCPKCKSPYWDQPKESKAAD